MRKNTAAVFRNLDSDKSGDISATEFSQSLLKLGMPADDSTSYPLHNADGTVATVGTVTARGPLVVPTLLGDLGLGSRLAPSWSRVVPGPFRIVRVRRNDPPEVRPRDHEKLRPRALDDHAAHCYLAHASPVYNSAFAEALARA